MKSGKVLDPSLKENRYILFTGAPGSRWSGVANMIYQSLDFDISDQTEERSYHHNHSQLHCGAYFDPGMEYDFKPSEWDKPFSEKGEGIRLIKSHTLSRQIDNFKKYPIIMVYRNDYECIEWWKEAGGFSIDYPDYWWYQNMDRMFDHIQKQNSGIMRFIYNNKDKVTKVRDLYELLELFNISILGVNNDTYAKKDVIVYVYKPTL